MFGDVIAKLLEDVLQVKWCKRMSKKVYWFSTALSNYALGKRASTAVTRSRSCLHTVMASDFGRVAVLCCSTVGQSKCLTGLQMKNAYTNMNFIYGSCNGNGRAAVVEQWQRYQHARFPNRITFVTATRQPK